MNIICEYFASNRLKLNASKTRLLYIKKQKKLNSTQVGGFLISDTEVNVKESTKLLGVTLDCSFDWNGQVWHIECKLEKAIFVICCINTLKNLALLLLKCLPQPA